MLVYLIVFAIIVCTCVIVLRVQIFAATRNQDRRVERDSSYVRHRDDNPYGHRRIPAFVRSGIILPDWSNDTVACDDLTEPKECILSDGFDACFECIESRQTLRVCAHFDHDTALLDERSGRIVSLPANATANTGYCVRTNVANDLRDLAASEGRVSAAKKSCHINNADWLLVRKRTDDDAIESSYNFVCRCKYPHLLTNVSGPQSECARDVACNGHGHLDAASINGSIDPFVNGVCVCENGWLAERDDTIGPYCREATFAEWPSRYFPNESSDDYPLSLVDSDVIDSQFREKILSERKDPVDTPVWLPDPCAANGCQLTRIQLDSEYSFVCADQIVIEDDVISSVSVGFTFDRDYLRNNGGQFPNACLRLTADDIYSNAIALQYMSQDWNDGSSRGTEVGFFVKKAAMNAVLERTFRRNGIDASAYFESAEYREFSNELESAKSTEFETYGILWTDNSLQLKELRNAFYDSLGKFVKPDRFDIGRHHPRGFFWVSFPFWENAITYNEYYIFNEQTPQHFFDDYRFNQIYHCGDFHGPINRSTKGLRVSEVEAKAYARALPALCYLTPENGQDSDKKFRPEYHCLHDNPSGAVLFDSKDHSASYVSFIAYPKNFDARRFCVTRNKSGT